jgi:glucose/arabinose dehydrogenase
MRRPTANFLMLATAGFLTGCTEQPAKSNNSGVGPAPQLPEPQSSLLPTINIAEVVGWPVGATPVPANGLTVDAFARGLDHPRWLYVLPNGDVLVAETDAPPREGGGIRQWVMKFFMKQAGSGGKSADRISLLRDGDNDGLAEAKTTFLSGLKSPFGMALINDRFFVANTDAIIEFRYAPGETSIQGAGRKLCDLPAGSLNQHWTKSLVASPDGSKLYVGVGSNSNIGENGLDAEANRAAILEVDASTGATRVFASGLRNPVGMAFHPQTGELWTVVNERDELGNDLVPDYLTSVKDGGFYGWPFSYFGSNIDRRVEPQRPDLTSQAIVPEYALGAHTASLGLTFSTSPALSEEYQSGTFIGQHGSWNRTPFAGYKVTFVPFQNGKPSGQMTDVLSGFLNAEGKAQGRPVGVVLDKAGSLLVADDVGNTIWRVAPAKELGAKF